MRSVGLNVERGNRNRIVYPSLHSHSNCVDALEGMIGHTKLSGYTTKTTNNFAAGKYETIR